MDVWLVLWLLMAWCFSTRTSVATVLSIHPCISSCLWVNNKLPRYMTINPCCAELRIHAFLPPGLSGQRGIVIACIRLSVRPSVHKLFFVCMITHHRFEMESPNLHKTCILGYSWLLLKVEVIDLDLQAHFGHFDSEFLGNLACLCNNF